MLEQTPLASEASDMKLHPELADADWCVGNAPPSRWDVSFSDRLWLTLRRWFARDAAASDAVSAPTLRVTSPIVTAERRQAA
jgi:hypothetical protein